MFLEIAVFCIDTLAIYLGISTLGACLFLLFVSKSLFEGDLIR